MKKLENKIEFIKEQLVISEKNENKKLFINEMKKIGIEKLPYAYSSLKQFIDSETMSYHYNKHYKGYVDKLNDALKKKNYGDLELEEIVKSISRFNKKIRDNAGGAFNHALFWKMLSPKTQTPSGPILEKIKKDFKTYQEFKKKFEEVAKERFGSGWVWLVLTKNNRLKVISTPNQDNPLMNVVKDGGYPLLGLDLWEHAYYLKYKNKRDDYIKNFWKCVNWEFVNKLYNMKTETKLNESLLIKPLLSEGKSERCSKEETEAIRFIFNINPEVKNIFKVGINKALKDVFAENYFEHNEYAPGETSGIYNLEKEGRSVINKLNTNYNCFCIILNDVNQVLRKENQEEIKLVGLTPKEQLIQVNKLVALINRYKFRMFNKDSSTFQNIMKVLTQTDSWGQKREDITIQILKKKFGEKNVVAVGKLGSKEDMIGGVDCIVYIKDRKLTCQIKPFTTIKKEDDVIVVYGSANVKKYNTNWLIFERNNKEIIIFRNTNTKIIDGNYVFPATDLIYTLS
jgi:superoxide dismutase, Fe-Mn family